LRAASPIIRHAFGTFARQSSLSTGPVCAAATVIVLAIKVSCPTQISVVIVSPEREAQIREIRSYLDRTVVDTRKQLTSGCTVLSSRRLRQPLSLLHDAQHFGK
jgi:hypothetical protein